MRLQRPRPLAGSVLLALSVLAAGAALAQAQAPAVLYLCPGNLWTNQIDAEQARARQCAPAGPGRLSQVSAQAAGVPQEAAPAAQEPASAAPSASALAPALAPSPPPAPARRAPPPLVSTADASLQRARDMDARVILQNELARTLEQQKLLSATAAGNPESQAALQRLRTDEAALRREIARLPG